MATCPTLSTGDAFLLTTLQHIDCQARTIGSVGYQALADPASPLAPVFTALLTIFVALFGLRMMMGEEPTLRDGVMAIVKIGIVLVIATSWPAYRTVIYDVVVDGPTQLSAALGSSAGLPGAEGDLVARLHAADAKIARLINLGTGRQELSPLTPVAGEVQRAPISDDPAFGTARVMFLASTIAAFAATRLTAGVLLALGPLFAGLLLFNVSRGVVLGWGRALVFIMLASVVITIVLGVELALLEPWLLQVLSLREARMATGAAPVELLIICLGFALALAGALAVVIRLAFALDVQQVWSAVRLRVQSLHQENLAPPPAPPASLMAEGVSSRARSVAVSIAASQRREQMFLKHRDANVGAAMSTEGAGASRTTDEFVVPMMGHALRRTKPRKSLGAALRDHRQ